MEKQLRKLMSEYNKKAKNLRDKADKDIYNNRANIAYNSEADILECVVYDLKNILDKK